MKTRTQSELASETRRREVLQRLDAETPGGDSQDLQTLLEARRRKPELHLTSREASSYVQDFLLEESDCALVERHLWDCAFCRGTIADLLQLANAAPAARSRRFLERFERHQRLRAAAEGAAAAVRARHREHGVSLVYEKDGVLVEEMPDGTLRPFDGEAVLQRKQSESDAGA